MFDELTGCNPYDAPAGARTALQQRFVCAPSSGAKTTSDLTYPQRPVSQTSQTRNFSVNHALPLRVCTQCRYRHWFTILKDFQTECCRSNADLLAGGKL
jgi:hypothetical protein